MIEYLAIGIVVFFILLAIPILEDPFHCDGKVSFFKWLYRESWETRFGEVVPC